MVTVPCGYMITMSLFMWDCVVLGVCCDVWLWWAIWLSELVREQSGAHIHRVLCGRLTVSFADCGREWPRPAKFLPSSKKAAVMEQKPGLSSLYARIDGGCFFCLSGPAAGRDSKTLFGVEKGKWFAVSSSSTITLQQSKADGSLEP